MPHPKRFTPAEKKRVLAARARRTATTRGSARAVQTPAEKKRAASIAKLQAGRRATAKRLSGQTATTQAQLNAMKKKLVPPAGREGMIGTFLEGRGRLEDALKPKRKKKP